jgi:hydrogenase maturation protease
MGSPKLQRPVPRLRPGPEVKPIPWLVIGYGNTLRRDDGAGVRVAEEIERLALPGVRVLTCHQLTPELAELLAGAGRVVFVDASAESLARVRLRQVQPARAAAPLAHAADPRGLLVLARELFGHAPRAWMLALPAPDLGFGEGLSAEAEEGVRQAVAALRRKMTKVECRMTKE